MFYLRKSDNFVKSVQNKKEKVESSAVSLSSQSWSPLKLIAGCAQLMTSLTVSKNPEPEPKKNKLYECKVCDIEFNGPMPYEEHMRSPSHLKETNNGDGLGCELKLLSCNVCNMTFSGPESQKQHFDGGKHKKKIMQLNEPVEVKQIPKQNGFELSCVVCNKTFSGPESQKQHTDGERHKKKVQAANMLKGLFDVNHNSHQLRCDVCSMPFSGPESRDQHLNGKKHKKRAQAARAPGETFEVNASVQVYWCEPCNITCTSKVSLDEHEASRNHAKKLARMKFEFKRPTMTFHLSS